MICAVCNKPIEGVSYTVVTEEYYLDCVCENCASFADDLGADVEENNSPLAGGVDNEQAK